MMDYPPDLRPLSHTVSVSMCPVTRACYGGWYQWRENTLTCKQTSGHPNKSWTITHTHTLVQIMVVSGSQSIGEKETRKMWVSISDLGQTAVEAQV